MKEPRAKKPTTGSHRPLENRSYLAVFAPSSMFLLPLPLTGELYIGPSQDGGVQVSQEAVAQLNARIVTRGGETIVSELEGSSEEVVVNGERFSGSRPLITGDVISTMDISMVLNRGKDLQAGPALLDMAQLQRRFPLELERARRHDRPLALLCVKVGEVLDEVGPLCDAIASGLRLIDIVAWNGIDEFIIILPETASGAEVPATRLLEDLQKLAPKVSAGLAHCPGDGTDSESLLTGARAAATAALPGSLKYLRDLGKTIKVGEVTAVAIDPRMTQIYEQVRKVAQSEIPVLVLGETGVGKEIVAQALHSWSRRKAGPMISINCAALTETLLQSELFGHERGAFTGATTAKQGLLESASGGTVHLDEVSECSTQTQAKLLRVLEEGLLRRLGSVTERKVDVRVVASTNRDLPEEVAAERFRKDLYYRLAATTILVPPLRKRSLDLPVLARLLHERACRKSKREVMILTEEVVQQLLGYSWPGNIRELKNLMGNLAAMVHEPVLQVAHLPDPLGGEPSSGALGAEAASAVPVLSAGEPALVEFRPLSEEITELEKKRMAQALAASNGVKVRAAKLISMPLRTFITKHNKYGL